VPLGAALQEQFAVRSLAETNDTGFLAIGAGLHFIAGTQLRRPRLLWRRNLEWAWLYATNPRLSGRHFLCGIYFFELHEKKWHLCYFGAGPSLIPRSPGREVSGKASALHGRNRLQSDRIACRSHLRARANAQIIDWTSALPLVTAHDREEKAMSNRNDVGAKP
jgi:Glycosyl transferase WecG/TagA/CpsF family